MRRRTITIAAPQQRHCNLGRSLSGGCMDGGCVDGCMPGVQAAIALGLSPMRNSVSQSERPGGQCRPNFQKMFSVPAIGTSSGLVQQPVQIAASAI